MYNKRKQIDAVETSHMRIITNWLTTSLEFRIGHTPYKWTLNCNNYDLCHFLYYFVIKDEYLGKKKIMYRWKRNVFTQNGAKNVKIGDEIRKQWYIEISHNFGKCSFWYLFACSDDASQCFYTLHFTEQTNIFRDILLCLQGKKKKIKFTFTTTS